MTEIKLNKDIEELRLIYYKDNNQKYFFGPNTRKQSIYLIIALITFPFFALYAWNLKDSWLLLLGLVLLLLVINDYWKVARPVIEWKKSVDAFLKKAENIKDLRLIYNEDYLIHVQDNEELKQNWEVIEKAIINDNCIWLFSDSNILIPKSAMKEIEYKALSEFILNKVRNVEKIISQE